MPEPCPPPEGWTLLEAAEALCPDLLEACQTPGDQRAMFARLDVDLKREALEARTDLAVIGRDLSRGIDAPMVRVPRDVLDRETAPEGSWFRLNIWNSTFEWRMPHPAQPTILHHARIVCAAPTVPPDTPPASTPRPAFTPAIARAWYRLRVARWPKDTAPPSEAGDLAAMRAAHEGTIPRDFIREVRRELAPAEWRKSGPRKPR